MSPAIRLPQVVEFLGYFNSTLDGRQRDKRRAGRTQASQQAVERRTHTGGEPGWRIEDAAPDALHDEASPRNERDKLPSGPEPDLPPEGRPDPPPDAASRDPEAPAPELPEDQPASRYKNASYFGERAFRPRNEAENRDGVAILRATTSASPCAKTPALGSGLPRASGMDTTSPTAKTPAKRVSSVWRSTVTQPLSLPRALSRTTRGAR